MDNKLQEWTAPQLMRLNQADTAGGQRQSVTENDPCRPTYLVSGEVLGGSPEPCGTLPAGPS